MHIIIHIHALAAVVVSFIHPSLVASLNQSVCCVLVSPIVNSTT